MTGSLINSSGEPKLSLTSKLVMIEVLVFFLPGLIIFYLYYEGYIFFNGPQLIMLSLMLLLVLAGLLTIKHIFDRFLLLSNIIKSGSTDVSSLYNIKDDTKELNEISQSFADLVNKFNETNSELQERIEEIAQIKVMEITLQRAKKEAEAANAAKTSFLSKRCSELNAPLDSIINYTNVLKASTYGSLTDNQMEFVNGVIEKGRHLQDLINGIVDYAKMEDEKLLSMANDQ